MTSAELARLETLIRQVQTDNPRFKGDPNGVVDGPLGALGRRTDGTAGTLIYLKTTAAGTLTGWTAIH